MVRKGVTYWYARINGGKTYCGKGDEGRKMAEAARAKYVAKEYENREIRAGLKVKRDEMKTVKDLANWYMTLPSVQEQKSFQRKTAACGHLFEHLGNKLIRDIEGDEQERYREKRSQEGAASGTLDYEIEILAAIYNTARKRRKITADAMPGEFIQKRERNPRRRITQEEYGKLLEHAHPDFRDILICGYESAMRSGEICNLTAGQVHLAVKHISGDTLDYIDLGIFDTKTGARRTVPVSDELKEVLIRRIEGKDPEDFVFTNGNSQNYSRQNLANHMRSTCKKAGVPYGDKIFTKKGEKAGIVFHCLRHTRTSLWVEAGFSDEIVRRATGHASLEAFKVYVKLDPATVMRLVSNKPDKLSTNIRENLGR